jgi:hypothetical protein
MSDAAEDIATGAEVVDLLVAMAKAALKSTRKTIIFEPFPTVVDPRNSTELALGPKVCGLVLVILYPFIMPRKKICEDIIVLVFV